MVVCSSGQSAGILMCGKQTHNYRFTKIAQKLQLRYCIPPEIIWKHLRLHIRFILCYVHSNSVLQMTLSEQSLVRVQLISSPLSSPLFFAPGTPCHGISRHNANGNDGLWDGEWNSCSSDALYRLIAYCSIADVLLNCFTEDSISAPVALFFIKPLRPGFLSYFSGFCLKLSAHSYLTQFFISFLK